MYQGINSVQCIILYPGMSGPDESSRYVDRQGALRGDSSVQVCRNLTLNKGIVNVVNVQVTLHITLHIKCAPCTINNGNL